MLLPYLWRKWQKNGENIGETGQHGLPLNIGGSTRAPAAPNSKRVVQLLLPPLCLIAATHHTTTQAKLVLGLSGGTLDCPAISDEHILGNFGSLGSRNNGPVHHNGHPFHSTFGVPSWYTWAQPVWYTRYPIYVHIAPDRMEI